MSKRGNIVQSPSVRQLKSVEISRRFSPTPPIGMARVVTDFDFVVGNCAKQLSSGPVTPKLRQSFFRGWMLLGSILLTGFVTSSQAFLCPEGEFDLFIELHGRHNNLSGLFSSSRPDWLCLPCPPSEESLNYFWCAMVILCMFHLRLRHILGPWVYNLLSVSHW